jgi:hypothetical protein
VKFLIGLFTALSLTATLSVANAQVLIGTPGPATATPVIPGIPFGATVPRVVSSIPTNGDQRADPTLRRITINFDQPMDVATFFWPLPQNQPDFPRVTAEPFWTNGNRTLVLPVVLAPNTLYRVPLNVGSQTVFRSATGVPLYPGVISFLTASGGGGSVPANRVPGYTPVPNVTENTPRVPGEGGVVGGRPAFTATRTPSSRGSVPGPNPGPIISQRGMTPGAALTPKATSQSGSPLQQIQQRTRLTPKAAASPIAQ